MYRDDNTLLLSEKSIPGDKLFHKSWLTAEVVFAQNHSMLSSVFFLIDVNHIMCLPDTLSDYSEIWVHW